LSGAGLGPGLRGALDETFKTVHVRMSAEGSRVVAAGTVGARTVAGALETGPRPARPRDAAGLLAQGRFAAVAAAAAAGKPAYLEGVALDPRGARAEDLLLH